MGKVEFLAWQSCDICEEADKMEQMMQSHRSTPKDGWIIGENGQIHAVARPQDIERYISIIVVEF